MEKGSVVHPTYHQCDQIGRFSKVPKGDKITCKSGTKILATFWSILKDNFKIKTAVTTLWGNSLRAIGILCNLIFGHT